MIKIFHIIPTLETAGAENMLLNHVSNLPKTETLNFVISFYKNEKSFRWKKIKNAYFESPNKNPCKKSENSIH